jgi:hypothetical protein
LQLVIASSQAQLERDIGQNENMIQDALDTSTHIAASSPLVSGPDAGIELPELGASPLPNWNSPNGDIVSNDTGLGNSTSIQSNHTVKAGGFKNRKIRKEVEDEEKWLLVCMPGKAVAKDPGGIVHLPAMTRKGDNSLIQGIKKEYKSGRSEWSQFRQLHGFSKVRLIKASDQTSEMNG